MGSIDWLPIETFDGRTDTVLLWVSGQFLPAYCVEGFWIGVMGAGFVSPAPSHWAEVNAPERLAIK